MPFWSYFRRLFGRRDPQPSESVQPALRIALGQGRELLGLWGKEDEATRLSDKDLEDAKDWAALVESFLLTQGRLGPLFVFNFRGRSRFPNSLRPLERPKSLDHACEFFGLGDRMYLRHCLEVRLANLEKIIRGDF